MVQDALRVGFVGHVLRDVIGNCANRRNLGGAMSHDGSVISWTQAESFAWDGEGTVRANFPITIRIRPFKESTDVSPVVLGSILVSTMVYGPAASATHSLQMLRQ